jgi:hypothetical protein
LKNSIASEKAKKISKMFFEKVAWYEVTYVDMRFMD